MSRCCDRLRVLPNCYRMLTGKESSQCEPFRTRFNPELATCMGFQPCISGVVGEVRWRSQSTRNASPGFYFTQTIPN